MSLSTDFLSEPLNRTQDLFLQKSTSKKECDLSNTFFGRIVTTIATSAFKVLKITILAMAILPAAPALGLTFYCTDDHCHSTSLSQISNFMMPGKQLARSGTAACDTNLMVAPQIECEKMTSDVFTHLIQSKTITQKDLDIYQTKGIIHYIKKQGMHIPFSFLIPVKTLSGYKAAIKYLETSIFPQHELFFSNPESILSLLTKLHSLIIKDDHTTYRTALKTVIADPDPNREILDIAKQKLNAIEYTIFERAFNSALKDSRKRLTDTEATIWRKAFFLGTHWEDIPAEMNTFASSLCQRMNEGGDYIDHASFAHTELTRIAPYFHGVGRLARLFMNAILVLEDHTPAVFPKDKDYVDAVQKGTKNPAYFTQYLRTQIENSKKILLKI